MLDRLVVEKSLHPVAVVEVGALAVQLAVREPPLLDADVPVGVAVYNISAKQGRLLG
jgi:hypothetical protein